MPIMKTKAAHTVYPYVLIFLLCWAGCVSAGRLNRLSRQEEKQGFKLLFDGNSMDQWRNYKPKSETIRPQWQVIDETLVLTAKGGRDLVTKEKFGYFDLRLEYTIAEKGNSGVMFRVVEETEERNAWRLAPEYQLYDSFNVKVRGDRCAGALYGLIAADDDLAKKPGEWNQVRILLEPAGANKERLRFWLNGKQTVDIIINPAPDSEWSKLLESKKAEDHFDEGFFKAKTGSILLQDHGARVAFRNIRIRRLDKQNISQSIIPAQTCNPAKLSPACPAQSKITIRCTLYAICYPQYALRHTRYAIRTTAEGGSRTLTLLRGRDFESRASASSATSAELTVF